MRRVRRLKDSPEEFPIDEAVASRIIKEVLLRKKNFDAGGVEYLGHIQRHSKEVIQHQTLLSGGHFLKAIDRRSSGPIE